MGGVGACVHLFFGVVCVFFVFVFWVLASVFMCKFDLHTAACKAL